MMVKSWWKFYLWRQNSFKKVSAHLAHYSGKSDHKKWEMFYSICISQRYKLGPSVGCLHTQSLLFKRKIIDTVIIEEIWPGIMFHNSLFSVFVHRHTWQLAAGSGCGTLFWWRTFSLLSDDRNSSCIVTPRWITEVWGLLLGKDKTTKWLRFTGKCVSRSRSNPGLQVETHSAGNQIHTDTEPLWMSPESHVRTNKIIGKSQTESLSYTKNIRMSVLNIAKWVVT